MIDRRTLLAGLAAGAASATAAPARAQTWRSAYPELVLAVIPAENASGVNDRYAPFVAYLSRELGTKVTLRAANDYAAVIEGQRAGNIHFAGYGPASFARARLTNVKVDRRHRRRAHPGDPQVLLRRRQRHVAAAGSLRDADRHRVRAAPPPAAGIGRARMTARNRDTAVHRAFVADRHGIIARHPAVFAADWGMRATAAAILIGAVVLYGFGLVALEITPGLFAGGLWRLIDIAGLMLPPEVGSWNRFRLYLSPSARPCRSPSWAPCWPPCWPSRSAS